MLALALAALAPVAGAQERDPDALTEVGGVELQSTDTRSKAALNSGELVPVIIVLAEDGVATYDGGIAGLPATSPKTTGKPIKTTDPTVKKYQSHLAKSHERLAQNLDRLTTGAEVEGTFDIAISAVSAIVPEGAVTAIEKLPNVRAVYLDELLQLDTEVSPEFIGADDLWDDLGGQSSAGEGIVVGVLDSGIWPEHASYSDPDPGGKSYPAPPTAPGSNGILASSGLTCDFGNTTFNPADAAFTCNNKLIGAYNFTDTYVAVEGLLPQEYDSARDANGHGTHTSSTAAGNGNVPTLLLGVNRGFVSGISPRSHVIMYKVCGESGCFGSDSMHAVDQAILDEVDVLNYSISGGGDPYGDAVSLAFLAAYDAGVLVTPSAGNDGPGADTVSHREPWTMTVGASTTDRHFISTIDLTADNSDTLQLTGATVTDGISSATDVVLADSGDPLCLDPVTPYSGEIVVCERGLIARVAKSFNVDAGGGAGMILYNPVLQGLATDNHFIPSVHIENDAGQDLLDFLDTHTGVTATFTQGAATAVQGDKMAAFSSRGGPGQTLGISKPDVTAPGVQILAGHTPTPATIDGGVPGEFFQSIQGTSMSAPQAAGAAAIVKAANPHWTPGQIKSALMMSGTTAVTKEDGSTAADAFDMGSGRIQPASAADAELTISDSAISFFVLEDELWNSNYPSLYVPNMPGVISVARTAHNELGTGRNWQLSVDAPSDMTVTVPNTLTLAPHGDKSFNITVDASSVPLGETRHASLYLESQSQTLHFPITIVRGELEDIPVSLDKTCTESDLDRGDTTDCTITAENVSFEDASVLITDDLPNQLKLDKSTLVGATVFGNVITFNGSLFAASPPAPDVVVDPLASPFGYFPLSLFGSSVDIGATDESIATFNVPSFDYAGQSYSTIGIVSNGYIVVGGGTGADVDFINTDLPDAAIPNNVLAPFWTDLNPAAGGRVLINVLGAGGNVWTVVEWESVENFGDGETNTTQVWIGINTDANPGEDISFVYGADVSDGDGSFLTVGVENKFGNEGGTVYFDGAGTPPAPSNPFPGYEVDVFSVPGAPGETHTITYTAEAKNKGAWTNYALMTSDAFQGVNVASFSGNVVK